MCLHKRCWSIGKDQQQNQISVPLLTICYNQCYFTVAPVTILSDVYHSHLCLGVFCLYLKFQKTYHTSGCCFFYQEQKVSDAAKIAALKISLVGTIASYLLIWRQKCVDLVALPLLLQTLYSAEDSSSCFFSELARVTSTKLSKCRVDKPRIMIWRQVRRRLRN